MRTWWWKACRILRDRCRCGLDASVWKSAGFRLRVRHRTEEFQAIDFWNRFFSYFFLSSDVRKQNRLWCNHQNLQNQKDPKSPQSGRFINRTAAFLRNRHQRRTKRRAASVKIPGEMLEHNGSAVSQINLPFSKFDRSSWLRHTWRFRLRQSKSQQRAVRKWFRHNQSMRP